MIDKAKAEELAKIFLDAEQTLEDDEYHIYEEHTSERQDHWAIYYDSKKSIETSDPSYILMFRPPVRVDKTTGTCRIFSGKDGSTKIRKQMAPIMEIYIHNLEGKIPESDTYHFMTPEKAHWWLTFSTNQDFGYDSIAWRKWIRENTLSE